MDRDCIERNWQQPACSVIQRSGRLTDGQFHVIAGEHHHLCGKSKRLMVFRRNAQTGN